MLNDPPKLIDLLNREFIPTRGISKNTGFKYRHALKQLAISLGDTHIASQESHGAMQRLEASILERRAAAKKSS